MSETTSVPAAALNALLGILVQFRVALSLVMDRQCLWEKALRAAFFIQVTGRH